MFGFGLKSKTKKILWKDFKYKCGPIQDKALDFLIKSGKDKLLNEYDYAIFLMFDSMNSLYGTGGDVEQFVKNHISNIEKIMFLAHTPNESIIATINFLKQKHNLGGLSNPQTSYEPALTFDELNYKEDTPLDKKVKQETNKGCLYIFWTMILYIVYIGLFILGIGIIAVIFG